MPMYEFQCVRCGNVVTVSLPVNARDTQSVWCRNEHCTPAVPGGVCRMQRQPSAPAFVVKGFNAKNGYST